MLSSTLFATLSEQYLGPSIKRWFTSVKLFVLWTTSIVWSKQDWLCIDKFYISFHFIPSLYNLWPKSFTFYIKWQMRLSVEPSECPQFCCDSLAQYWFLDLHASHTLLLSMLKFGPQRGHEGILYINRSNLGANKVKKKLTQQPIKSIFSRRWLDTGIW